MVTGENSNGRKTLHPESIGESEFFHVEVLPKKIYKRFRRRNSFGKDGIEIVEGQRANGVWQIIKWLISKKIAHIENDRLIADTEEAQQLFDRIGFVPKQLSGDIFEARANL